MNTVMEREGGSLRTILGYPTAEIERLVVADPAVAAPTSDNIDMTMQSCEYQ